MLTQVAEHAPVGHALRKLRIAHRWHWLSDGQYRHVSAMVAEIGRLIGGWIRATSDASESRRRRSNE